MKQIKEVNIGRQLEFDLVKAITILLMVWTHVYETLSTGFGPSLSSMNALYRGGLFGAATFMFCMGMGMAYTRFNQPADFIRRGLHIIFLGALLNVCRQLIPPVICGSVFRDPASAAYFVEMLGVDILQFAGLAFLLMALLRKIGLSFNHILIVSLLMSGAAWFLEGVQTGNFFIDQAMGYIWGNDSESYFPLMNWFVFVAAGAWFGKMYRYIQDKKKFHKLCFPISLLLTAVCVLASVKGWGGVFRLFTSERYLAHRMLPDAVTSIVASIWLVSLFYYIGRVLPQKSLPTLVHPSKHVCQYYCISWVLIYIVSYLFDGRAIVDSDLTTILLWLGMMSMTVLIAVVYEKYLQERFMAFFNRARVFWIVLVFVAMIAAGVYGYYLCDGVYPTFLNDYSIKGNVDINQAQSSCANLTQVIHTLRGYAR